jgi:hypothetical protein
MTRLEFAEKMKKQRRADWLVIVPMVIGLVVGLLAILVFFAITGAHESGAQGLAFLVGIFLFVFLWAALGTFNHRRRMRKAGMFCTKCDTLLHTTAISIAIATGNCSICGQSFLED